MTERCYKCVVAGEPAAQGVVLTLLRASQAFHFEPLPDDCYEIEVKEGARHILDSATKAVASLGEPPQATEYAQRLRADPDTCPRCGNKALITDEPATNGLSCYYVTVKCSNCDGSWDKRYVLEDIVGASFPEKPDEKPAERPMEAKEALRLAASILQAFGEAGNLYDDYKREEGFTDEQYDQTIAAMKSLAERSGA